MSEAQKIIGILIGLASLIGIAIGAENHYATKLQLAGVEQKVDQNKIEDQVRHLKLAIVDLYNMKWKLEERLRVRPSDLHARETLGQISSQIMIAEEELKVLQLKLKEGG